MAYFLHEFDSLAIPLDLGSGSHDITLGERRSPLIEVPGGVYDPLGSDQAPRGASRLSARVLLLGANSAAVKTALDAWSAKVGIRGNLSRISDAGFHQTVTARLVEAKASRSPENIRLLPLSLTWDVLSPVWSGTAHSDTTTLVSTSQAVTVANGGNARVTNPIITVMAAATPITYVNVHNNTLGINWYWNGSLPAGSGLIVDCGALSVLIDGTTDAYAGFMLSTVHTIDEWMRLAPGNTALTVARTGGSADSTVNVAFSDGWS